MNVIVMFQIWLYTVVPSIFSFLLQISSLLIDSIIAFKLAWDDSLLTPGLATLIFIYTPAVITLVLKPPKPPQVFSYKSIAGWLLKTMFQGTMFPIIITVRYHFINLLTKIKYIIITNMNNDLSLKHLRSVLLFLFTFNEREGHTYLLAVLATHIYS